MSTNSKIISFFTLTSSDLLFIINMKFVSSLLKSLLYLDFDVTPDNKSTPEWQLLEFESNFETRFRQTADNKYLRKISKEKS